MLVLTRKQGEQIRIGDNVVITVVRTKGKTVRLGIQAPAAVPVLRGEIAFAIADDEQHKVSSGDEHDDGPWTDSAERGRGPLRQLVAARGV